MSVNFWQMTRNVWDTVKIVIQALLIALVIRTCLFQSYNIPSGSMIPSLLINDFLFVSKYSYGYSKYSLPLNLPLFSGRILASEPKRGDVIVFKLPRDDSQDYIKRLVGLPGDRIQMQHGRLFINGAEVPRERIADYPYQERSPAGAVTWSGMVAQYNETLPGGVKHRIIEIKGDTGDYDSTGVYEVPQGHYFMMGDNRDNSLDSRADVGFVPFVNLVGRAEVIFLSVDEEASAWKFWLWPWTMRTERMFQPVR